MNILLEEHQEFIFKLLDGQVEFILIGGYAVIFHGYGRTTGDMDLWIKPDNENKKKLVEVLRTENIEEDDLKVVASFDFNEINIFHIGSPPARIDFLTKVPPLKYEEADEHKDFFILEGKNIPVLHLNDLLINKMLSNRPKDIADVDELKKIQQLKNKK